MKLATIFAVLALLTASIVAARATPIDPVAVTLNSPTDVTARRQALIQNVWGTSTLPTALPTGTAVANPFGAALPNVRGTYQYHTVMSNGQTNDSILYMNSAYSYGNLGPTGQVVILNMGHQFTNYWPNFNSIYNTLPMMKTLLSRGYSVFAMNMPKAGDSNAHIALFKTYGNAAMQYFLQPAIQAINFWRTGWYSSVHFVGLSGGGLTGTLLQALDTRVKTTVLDAGSLPGVQFCCSQYPIQNLPNQVDGSKGYSEGSWAPFYSIAGYEDLYLMGASGAGRRQVQILNINDTCCFGPREWNSIYAAANGGRTWYQQVSYYNSLIQAKKSLIPNQFSVVEDYTAVAHQFSNPAMINLTLNTLLGSPPPLGVSTLGGPVSAAFSLASLDAPVADTVPVPEPTSLALLGGGLAALSLIRRPSRWKYARVTHRNGCS